MSIVMAVIHHLWRDGMVFDELTYRALLRSSNEREESALGIMLFQGQCAILRKQRQANKILQLSTFAFEVNESITRGHG